MLSSARSHERPGAESEPLAPEIVDGRYEVQAVVGRGGMGAVYHVRDLRTGEQLALKRLNVRSRRKNETLALFEREFHTLAQLRHPRIIEVRDYGVDPHGSYYTMELLPGSDLRELSPLPWPVACGYLREVATSLALLHARRLVHRDVTPKNVRVGADGHCKLIDFGALADFGANADVVGTPPCVPPEAIEGKPIDQRLDLYALGCVAYFMLTGKHAYPATDSRQLRTFWARPPEAPSSVAPAHGTKDNALPAIPPALDALVLSLMALDPMARPSSAHAVIDRLDVLTRGAVNEDSSLAESSLMSLPLCGRKRELERVKLGFERSQRGRGATIVLRGPMGIGRTRLLSEIELRAKLHGFLTLRVDGAAYARPYGSAIALAEQLAWRLPELVKKHAHAHALGFTLVAPQLAATLGLRAEANAEPRAEPPRDPVELRTLCQGALQTLFAEVSREKRIAILVDDLHRVDEASLAVLGSLSREAKHLPLMLVLAVRALDEAVNESALDAITLGATQVELSPLDEKQQRELLSAVFGDANNLGRLSSFLHERSKGVPAATVALLRFLLARGELRHRDGTWVLPNEPARIAMPERDSQLGLERLRAMPDATLALARALSLQRGTSSPGLCAALAHGMSASELADALEALVRAEILLSGPEGYRFASEALREAVVASIEPEARLGLHMRLAEALLASGINTPHERLAAGLHLLEANDPRGLELAARAAIALSERGVDLGSAVRPLERAFAIARERGAPLTFQLALLSPLGLAAYTVDHRLTRYLDAIIEAADAVTGLPLGRKLFAKFGNLAQLLGLGWSMLRYYLRPRRERIGSFREIARHGFAAMVAIAGRSAICLDKATIERIVEVLQPLRVLGKKDPGCFAVDYIEGLAMVTEDRCDRAYQYWRALEARLNAPGSFREVPNDQRDLWAGGIAYVLGLLEGFRGDPQALERAEALERSGKDIHRMVAAQIRLQYHGFRGEAEQVRLAHLQMEASAIQCGCSWQVDTWSAIAVNLFGTLWHDVIVTKRAMRETQRMQTEILTLKRYAITSEATYLLRRGQPRDCADLYEAVLTDEAPLERMGWATSHGMLAEAYCQLGMYAEAKAVCERVFAHVDREDRRYFALRMTLEISYAVAIAALGEPEHAETHLLELLELYGPEGSPVALGSVHEALAKIALERSDRKKFTLHMKEVGACFGKLGNPALIARFQGLGDLAGEGGGIVTKIAIMREVRAFEAALEPISDRVLGARHVLAWLMRTCEGYDGYLFGQPGDDEEPRLLAATSDAEPAQDTFDQVAGALRSFGGDGDTTNFGTGAATRRSRDGSSTHLFLLSYLEADAFEAQGALMLIGRSPTAPPVRYELLQAAALQLRRLYA